MAQLWGGRFTKQTDQMVYQFNASLSFDQRLYKQDIEGSIAHVTMLSAQKLLSDEEKNSIISELKKILEEIESGSLVFSEEYEEFISKYNFNSEEK